MKQVRQIIELLEDRSFPQIVLLDGGWGSGKTHFIKQHLKPELLEKFRLKVYFFSLYGISSIDDFRDRIISLSLTENEQASILTKYLSKIVDGAAINLGEKGVGAVLSGAAGAYKYKLYGELNDCVLILDDLERVTDEKLIRDILGECLSLAESKNIKIVIVANEDKLNCKGDIEKVFADKYRFGFSHEEVTAIIKEEFSSIDDKLANELLLNITAIDSKNIRVLKRAISKFTRIKEEVSKIDGVDIEQALPKLLGDIIRICCARFEHLFSKEKIIQAINSKILRQLDESNNDANDDYKKLDYILFNGSYFGADKKLINYCCDGLYEFKNLKIELKLPMKRTLLDKMRSPWSQNKLSEEDFKKGLLLLEEFIYRSESSDIYEWYKACDTLIYFIDNKIIEAERYNRNNLLNLCANIEVTKFEVPDEEENFKYKYEISFHNNEISRLFYSKKSELELIRTDKSNSCLSQNFQTSWEVVEDEFHDNYMHKPILHKIGIERIKVALKSWSNADVFQFVRFIEARYNFNNIEDFFEPEVETLKEISSITHELQIELKFGLKVASLIKLNKILIDTYTKIERRLSEK